MGACKLWGDVSRWLVIGLIQMIKYGFILMFRMEIKNIKDWNNERNRGISVGLNSAFFVSQFDFK